MKADFMQNKIYHGPGVEDDGYDLRICQAGPLRGGELLQLVYVWNSAMEAHLFFWAG
jgi:hypothetical protein